MLRILALVFVGMLALSGCDEPEEAAEPADEPEIEEPADPVFEEVEEEEEVVEEEAEEGEEAAEEDGDADEEEADEEDEEEEE